MIVGTWVSIVGAVITVVGAVSTLWSVGDWWSRSVVAVGTWFGKGAGEQVHVQASTRSEVAASMTVDGVVTPPPVESISSEQMFERLRLAIDDVDRNLRTLVGSERARIDEVATDAAAIKKELLPYVDGALHELASDQRRKASRDAAVTVAGGLLVVIGQIVSVAYS